MARRVQLIRSNSLPTTPYAHAAAVPQDAHLVLTAGACPLDAAGNVVAPGDLRRQTERSVANLVAMLDAAGSSLADVVKTTVYVASQERGDLVAAWNVVAAAFAGHEVPSTLLGVAVFGYPDQLVEIEAVAIVRPEARTPGDG